MFVLCAFILLPAPPYSMLYDLTFVRWTTCYGQGVVVSIWCRSLRGRVTCRRRMFQQKWHFRFSGDFNIIHYFLVESISKDRFPGRIRHPGVGKVRFNRSSMLIAPEMKKNRWPYFGGGCAFFFLLYIEKKGTFGAKNRHNFWTTGPNRSFKCVLECSQPPLSDYIISIKRTFFWEKMLWEISCFQR